MRPQSRPFVVEIKRSKKSPAAPAEARETESPVPAAWADAPERSFGEASPARQAAEALFGQIARPAPVPAAVGILESESAASIVAQPPARRVLFALEPTPVAAEPPSRTKPRSLRESEPKVRRPRTRRPAEAAEPVVPASPAPKSILARPRPALSRETPEQRPDLGAEESAARTRRSSPRYGRKVAELARGERWKRRLPAACR